MSQLRPTGYLQTVPALALTLSLFKSCVVPPASLNRFVDLAGCVVSQLDSTFMAACINEVNEIFCSSSCHSLPDKFVIVLQTTVQWVLDMTLVHRMPLSV